MTYTDHPAYLCRVWKRCDRCTLLHSRGLNCKQFGTRGIGQARVSRLSLNTMFFLFWCFSPLNFQNSSCSQGVNISTRDPCISSHPKRRGEREGGVLSTHYTQTKVGGEGEESKKKKTLKKKLFIQRSNSQPFCNVTESEIKKRQPCPW